MVRNDRRLGDASKLLLVLCDQTLTQSGRRDVRLAAVLPFSHIRLNRRDGTDVSKLAFDVGLCGLQDLVQLLLVRSHYITRPGQKETIVTGSGQRDVQR